MTKTAFAFDVGNGFVKARNSKRIFIAPSVIAKEESLGVSSISGISSYDSDLDIETYESNLDHGTSYVWGEGINQAVSPNALIQTYTHQDRYSQLRFKLLCSFILGELASDYEDHELTDVVVVTGLPSQEINTKDAEEFKKFLEQKHVITRNNEQRVINVTDVRMIEQPLGTLLNEYVSDDLKKWHTDFANGTITVIDFGAGTTILDTFHQRGRLEDKSNTEYEGMNDIHRRIAKKIEREQGVKGLSPSFVETGFRNGTLVAELSARKKYAFDDIAKEVIEDFVSQRISEIDTTLTNRNSIDSFILTGGGVNIVGEVFKKTFNEDAVKVVKEAQESNLNGFYKLACSVSKEK